MTERFFLEDLVTVAARLIGCGFYVNGVGGPIGEPEAYGGRRDPSCHAYGGRRGRCEALYGAPGTLYVYRHPQLALCERHGRAARARCGGPVESLAAGVRDLAHRGAAGAAAAPELARWAGEAL